MKNNEALFQPFVLNFVLSTFGVLSATCVSPPNTYEGGEDMYL